jgi:hypothetical protein
MKKLLAILLLWIPFSLAAIVAIPVLLYGLLTEDESIWEPVGRAMDKLLAALFGFSGNHTLSAELAISYRLQLLRKFLDLIEAEHCEKSARAEGLIK